MVDILVITINAFLLFTVVATSSEALRVRTVEALLAEAEELLIEEMKHPTDLRLSSLVDSSEEALLDAVATSTPMRRSRVISLPTSQSNGYIYGTGFDTVERA